MLRIVAPHRLMMQLQVDRTRIEVELYDSQLIPIFTLHRYHEADFRSRYTSQHPWPQDMPTDFCPIGAVGEIESRLKAFFNFHFRRLRQIHSGFTKLFLGNMFFIY